ncbi:MAG TPA: 4-alpha-glucanotransferase [Actinomycetota bacterium]
MTAAGPARPAALLPALAHLYGVQTRFTNAAHRRVVCPPDAVLAGLRALGAPVETMSDVPEAHRARRLELWRRTVEPVTVAWDGRLPASLPVRLPEALADDLHDPVVESEVGSAMPWGTASAGPLTVLRKEDVEGEAFVEFALPLARREGAGRLPFGYHTLRLHAGSTEATSLVISAPRRARAQPGRTWGVFQPLYALRSERSWGVGDFSDLEELLHWVAGLGGSMVATLPLLAAFLDRPFEPSPYSPASRLFWNELYVDVTRAPELERSPAARSLLASRALRAEIGRLRSAPVIDYRRAMAAKRKVLILLARSFFDAGGSGRREAFRAFLRSSPGAADYARFRAACARHEGPWSGWPRAQRDGRLPADGGDEDVRRYHLYAQWLADEQIEGLARRTRQAGSGLYFDAPLGVNADGFDVWLERTAFVLGAATGAPPDLFFQGGQNWGFPPPHPEGIREQGYRYFIASIRHLLRHADVVRLDHVMGLHRLYTIPLGSDPREGVYIRYRPDEHYAILALESHRSGTVIVGEDLGTVPEYVRSAMAAHGIYRTFVLQFQLRGDRRRAIKPIPRHSMVGLNTHDLPPFAAFWRGLDIGPQEWGGRASRRDAAARRQRARVREALADYLRRRGLMGKDAGPRAALRGALAYMASSEARMMTVSLEDLWLETRRQNVPGTVGEHPNWRRPARYAFEEFRGMRAVVGTLDKVDRLRRDGTKA